MPRGKRKRERKFSYILDNAQDERTKPLVLPLHIIIGSFVTGLFQNIQEQTKALVFVFVLVDEQAIIVDKLIFSFPLSLD